MYFKIQLNYLWLISWCCQYLRLFSIDDRMTREWWTGKDLEGNSCGLTKAQSHNLFGWTEKNHENLSHDSQCPGNNSNLAPSKWKSDMLLLQLPAISFNSFCAQWTTNNIFTYTLKDFQKWQFAVAEHLSQTELTWSLFVCIYFSYIHSWINTGKNPVSRLEV